MQAQTVDRLRAALACPRCHAPLDIESGDVVRDATCTGCHATYPAVASSLVLLSEDHPLRASYAVASSHPTGLRARIESLIPTPEARVWTRRSMRAAANAVDEIEPERADRLVVHVGAGFETVSRQILERHPDVVKVGLPHKGEVDVVADLQQFPFVDDSVDLIFSSSILEHVEDPERAVSEMARVLRPGGRVYAEIPFLRAYHMAPIDYQRYTIAGIQALFGRHGFARVDAGICSGPATTWALLLRDTLMAAGRWLPVRAFVYVVVGWLVHPLKYLDRLLEHASWAEYVACNFYYYGAWRDVQR